MILLYIAEPRKYCYDTPHCYTDYQTIIRHSYINKIQMPPSKDNKKQLSVIIPIYNEIKNVEPLLKQLHTVLSSEALSQFKSYEIVLVDDGSTDGTEDFIKQKAEQDNHLKGILLRRNFGKSFALEAGFQNVEGDIVVTIDADLQDDPEMIPPLIEKLSEGYDCVSGWRRNRKDPIHKRLPSKVQTYLAWLTGPRIHDYVCGLKAYRSEAVKNLKLYGEQHRYIPAMLHKQGFRITELEVNHRPRKHGTTKYGSARLIKGSLDLLFNAFWNRYSTRPLHFFGGFGLFSFLFGTIVGGQLLVQKYVFGSQISPQLPRLLLVTLLIIFGGIFFLFGLLSEIILRTNYDNGASYSIERIID